MAATHDGRPEAIELYIGEGVTIKGEVAVPETVLVNGVLEGDISVGHLIVRESGTIKGHVRVAQNAEIFGQVFEKLDVRGLLILRAGCRVEANVSCGILSIEQGASFTGDIKQGARSGNAASKRDRKQDARSGNAASSPALNLSALEMPGPITARTR